MHQPSGREEMLQIAIEEWAGASPIYTRRMQKALNYEGVDVITIFKGLQLDIGAPPQFMDFRYTVHDRWHGEFHLDHCGALMDVEPMGEDYVRGDVPRHRGPDLRRHRRRHQPQGADPPDPPPAADTRRPAPALRVDGDHRRVASRRPRAIPALAVIAQTRAASRANSTRSTRPTTGSPTTRATLVSDVDFAAFSHSALVRIADEVCLQMHLLNLSFVLAVGKRGAHRRAAARPRSAPSS